MDPQTPNMIQLGDNELEFDLNDYMPDGAELKSDLPEQIGFLTKKGYSVAIAKLYEVHGNFDDTTQNDATLLVLKVSPRLDDPKRCFQSFDIRLAVTPVPGCDSNDMAPYVIAYEPSQDGAVYFSEHVSSITQTGSIEASISGQAPVGGVSAGLSAAKSRTKEFQQRVLHEVTSHVEFDKSDKGPDKIQWRLEPATKADGIGDSLGIAILIRREPGAKLSIQLDTRGDVGFREKFADKLESFKLQKRQKLTLGPFDPSTGAMQSVPEGVNEKNLHDCSTQEILKHLAFLHIPEKVAPKQFYKDGSTIPPHSAPKDMPQPTTRLETVTLQPPESKDLVEATDIEQSSYAPEPIKSATHEGVRMHSNTFVTAKARGDRHRKMAALYQRLAELHREEAKEADLLGETCYADEAQRY